MGREDDHLALGHLGLLLDEHRAAIGQFLDHMLVVDDLLADIDGGAVMVECTLDGLHGAIDTGAVSARRSQQDALRRGGRGRGHAQEGSEGS